MSTQAGIISVALPRAGHRDRAASDVAADLAPRFPQLDAVRALAAVAVVVYHTTWGGLRLDPALAPLGMRLNVVGVPMFMALSGFLLYRPFLAARRRGTPRPSLRRYATGRVLRLVPAYWAALLVLGVLTTLHGDVLGGRFWVYFGFLQTYADWNALQGLSHAWTLCLEAAFYVFLALWVLGLRATRFSLRRELLLMALLAAVSLALQYEYWAAQGRWGNLDITFPAMMFMFSAGMAMAAFSVAYEGREHRSSLLRGIAARPGWCWIAAAAVYVVLCYALALPPRGAAIGDYTAAGWLLEQGLGAAVAVLILLPAVFGSNRGSGVPDAVLSSPLLLYLGRISYGVYLWHLAVLGWVEGVFLPRRTWDSLGLDLLLVLSVSALIASLSWVIVEKPFLQLKGRSTPAPQPDHPGHHQGPQQAATHNRREPSRPLGIPWQDHVAPQLARDNRGTACGGAASFAATGDRLGSAPAAGAVHRDQLGGRPGGDQQVPVPQPGATQVGGAHPQQPAPSSQVDLSATPDETGRHHSQPGDRILDRG
jgi:peptidoglycan/LPS O-acetylase OafA/YrhL